MFGVFLRTTREQAFLCLNSLDWFSIRTKLKFALCYTSTPWGFSPYNFKVTLLYVWPFWVSPHNLTYFNSLDWFSPHIVKSFFPLFQLLVVFLHTVHLKVTISYISSPGLSPFSLTSPFPIFQLLGLILSPYILWSPFLYFNSVNSFYVQLRVAISYIWTPWALSVQLTVAIF